MINRIRASPTLARVLPFGAFALLTLGQNLFGRTPQYWIYALKCVVGAWLLWLVRRQVKEMSWKISWEAAVAVVVVFLAWVGLDGLYPFFAQRSGTFNPPQTFGDGSAFAWVFIGVRLVGSSVVVPPLEEVFYRSFLYRYIIRADFLAVPLKHLNWKAFVLTGTIFGVSHFEWLPGILCGFVYQGLVCRKDRLGDAVTAHAVTNFLLGLWVITRGAYQFW